MVCTELQSNQLSVSVSVLGRGELEGIDRSFMQAAAARAGMFVASFAHPKKGCLLFVNLLCSPQAGLNTEQHPCQHSGPEGGVLWSLGLAAVEGLGPSCLPSGTKVPKQRHI